MTWSRIKFPHYLRMKFFSTYGLYLALLLVGAFVSAVLVLLFLSVEWVIAMLRHAFARKQVFAPAMSSPLDLSSSAHLIITVHGTFARGAQWTHQEQQLHAEISARHRELGLECSWHNFEWGGNNTVASRRDAILCLSDFVGQIFEANPDRHVVLLAHSHGGNIALKASEQFFEKPNLRLVTMATPFLIAQRRPATRHLRDLIPIINGVAAAGIGLGCAELAAGILTLAVPEHVKLLVGVLFFLLAEIREHFSRTNLVKDQEDLLRSSPNISRLTLAQDKLLVCSRAGDEADGGLKLASLASAWITRHLSVIRFMPPGMGFTKTPRRVTRKRLVRALIFMFQSSRNFGLEQLAVLVLASMCLEFLHRAVGTRTALAAVTVAVSSSETPPGTWTHYQSNISVRPTDVPLSHSQIYLDPTVLSAIADWLYPVQNSHPEPPNTTPPWAGPQ